MQKGELLYYGCVRRPGSPVVPDGAPHQAPRRYCRLSVEPLCCVCLKGGVVGVVRLSRVCPCRGSAASSCASRCGRGSPAVYAGRKRSLARRVCPSPFILRPLTDEKAGLHVAHS